MDPSPLEATPSAHSTMNAKKLLIAALILTAISLYLLGGGEKFLNIDFYQHLFQHSPWMTTAVYFVLFVLSTSFSLPVTAILMVGSGIIFGLTTGAIISIFAMTLGGTASCLSGRFLFRDIVERRLSGYIGIINRGLESEGGFYLFSLRIIPLLPFWLVNLSMGVTSVTVSVFMLATFFGMLTATLIFVYAGSQLGNIK